jgi:hypothetical protein
MVDFGYSIKIKAVLIMGSLDISGAIYTEGGKGRVLTFGNSAIACNNPSLYT